MRKVSLNPVSELEASVQEMVKQALRVRLKAHAPYSKYLVGCCLVSSKGNAFYGCNVENASYPAGICAERSAISAMVSDGDKKCRLVVIVASSKTPAWPCGMCLQVLNEFSDDCEVISVTPDGKRYSQKPLQELFPFSFSPAKLKE